MTFVVGPPYSETKLKVDGSILLSRVPSFGSAQSWDSDTPIELPKETIITVKAFIAWLHSGAKADSLLEDLRGYDFIFGEIVDIFLFAEKWSVQNLQAACYIKLAEYVQSSSFYGPWFTACYHYAWNHAEDSKVRFVAVAMCLQMLYSRSSPIGASDIRESPLANNNKFLQDLVVCGGKLNQDKRLEMPARLEDFFAMWD